VNIYIVSATQQEVAPSIAWCHQHFSSMAATSTCFASFKTSTENEIHFFNHGVGAPGTIHSLTKLLATTSDISLLIQAGIAGVFEGKGSLEQVYNISSDCFADLGAQEADQFVPLTQMQLHTSYEHLSANQWLLNIKQPYPAFFLGLPQAKGITVNTVTGTAATATLLNQSYNASTESMEGAALHLCALDANIPFVQLRAASNYVGVRDKSQWHMSAAIDQLNITLCQYLQTLA
jgi:futalosine hydrolase